MYKKFLSYIKNEALFGKKDRILVAVSGGMDSITLCELLRIAEFDFGIAHFNHVTRNGESDLDEHFVREYAKQYSIPFYTTKVDINKIIEDKQGGNFQNLARQHRYAWLESLRKEEDYDYIASAHHHNDQIETFLFHFSRGTGLDGLTGIPSKQDRLVRPMLGFTRAEIEEYVFKNKIDYRVDSSNSSNKYSRNYIRHGIIPSFKILNENFEHNAHTTIENLSSAKNLYNHLIKEILKKHLKKKDNGHYHLSLLAFDNIPQNMQKQLCFELIRTFGFNFAQVCQLLNSLDQRGKTFYSDEYVLLIEKGLLLIRRLSEKMKVHLPVDKECLVPGFGKLEITEVKAMNEYPENPNIEYIDAQNLEFPLLIRNKEVGDRFKPIGMKGRSKKLKDFFTDLKLNKFEKDNVLVLTSKQKVVWVIGYRLSEYFKIGKRTKTVLKLTWTPENGKQGDGI